MHRSFFDAAGPAVWMQQNAHPQGCLRGQASPFSSQALSMVNDCRPGTLSTCNAMLLNFRNLKRVQEEARKNILYAESDRKSVRHETIAGSISIFDVQPAGALGGGFRRVRCSVVPSP